MNTQDDAAGSDARPPWEDGSEAGAAPAARQPNEVADEVVDAPAPGVGLAHAGAASVPLSLLPGSGHPVRRRALRPRRRMPVDGSVDAARLRVLSVMTGLAIGVIGTAFRVAP